MLKLNEKQKSIINIVAIVVQIIIVLLAVILSAIILANPNAGNGEVGNGSIKLLPVLTNSMAGSEKDSFEKGDLIVAGKPKNADELEVGDIITFKITIGGVEELNTHRIVSKATASNGKVWFNTKGDNNTGNDEGFVYASDVLAVYKYHLNGVGSAIYWLQQPTNFLLVIVLPLIVLFIINIVLFVRMIMQQKLNKVKNTAVADEEEIKRKAIEEYLAKNEQDKKPDETESADKK